MKTRKTRRRNAFCGVPFCIELFIFVHLSCCPLRQRETKIVFVFVFLVPFLEHFNPFVSYGIRGLSLLPVEFTAKHSEPNAAVLLNSTLDSPPNSLSQCNKGLFRTEVLRLFRVSPFVHLQYSTYLVNVNSFSLFFIKII